MTRVSRIMTANVLTLKKEAKISDAARLMANKPQGCVVIVEGKKPIGIITESDIVRNLVSNKLNLKEKVTELMTSPLTTIKHDAKLEQVNKIIDAKHFRRYPVVENENLVGLVNENQIVHAINDNVRFHRHLQNAVLVVFVIFEFFVFILYRYSVNLFPFLR